MRKALLFMILINSITFVTNNLAMEEEEEDDIEMSSDLENQVSEKKVNASQKKKRRCYKKRKSSSSRKKSLWCKMFSIGLLLTALLLGPELATKITTDSMNEMISPITVYSGNITELGCTSTLTGSTVPEYAKEKGEKSEKCYIEECEKYKKYLSIARFSTMMALLRNVITPVVFLVLQCDTPNQRRNNYA